MIFYFLVLRRNNRFFIIFTSIWILYTVTLLHFTGGHYTNDILFGLLWSVTSFILSREYGYSVSHHLLKVYIKILGKCCGANDDIIRKSFHSEKSRKQLEENLIQ